MGERRTRGCKCVAAHTTHQMQVGVKEHPQWQTYTGSPTYDYMRGLAFSGFSMRVHRAAPWSKYGR